MIEIEKKFLLSFEQQQRLLEGASELGEKLVTDTYYDTEAHSLTLNDLWFRYRDGSFELKAPLTSSTGGTTNRYHELSDRSEIAHALDLDHTVDMEVAIKNAGIKPFVTCYTARKSYEKDGFHIDIDTATFANSHYEYSVAEIELLVDDESQADEAEARIIAIARDHGLVTDQLILGKVIAYLRSDVPEHYDALLSAGVLK